MNLSAIGLIFFIYTANDVESLFNGTSDIVLNGSQTQVTTDYYEDNSGIQRQKENYVTTSISRVVETSQHKLNELTSRMPLSGTEQPNVREGLNKTSLEETTETIVSLKNNTCSDKNWQPDLPDCSTSVKAYAYSCKNRCGDSVLNATDGPYCSCNPLCILSKDCCKDFEQYCPGLFSNGKHSYGDLARNTHLECRHIFGQNTHEERFWMVTRCPSDFNNSDIRRKCEHEVDLPEIVPVTSHHSHITYKNVFCAKCNNVTDMTKWDFSLYCEEHISRDSFDTLKELESMIKYEAKCKTWYEAPERHNCLDNENAWLEDPQCHNNIHGCIQSYVDLCEQGPQEPILRSTIHEGFRKEAWFKNVYCSLCYTNIQYTINDISCDVTQRDPCSEMFSFPSHVKKRAPPDCLPTRDDISKYSFGILIDFDVSDGGTVGFKASQNIDETICSLSKQSNQDCSLFCMDGYEYYDGQCIGRNSTINSTDCIREQINLENIDFFPDGSIKVNQSQRLFHEGDFVMVGNFVYICVNSTGVQRSRLVWKFDYEMGLLTIICTSLSILCLFIRLILQPVVPLFQNFPGKQQFSLVLSLFLASVFFLIGPNCIHIKKLCVTLGVLIHWSYLVAFTWTVIIARDMFYIFRPSSFSKSSDNSKSTLIRYIFIAWGTPALIVGLALGLDFSSIDPSFKPKYGEGTCWITQRYPLLIFFAAPIGIAIVLNIIFFIPTAVTLWKSTKQRKKTSNSKTEYPFGIYVKLFFLMGFTWIFGFIAPLHNALWYIFTVLNSGQGIYIFLAFVIQKSVWKSLKSRFSPSDFTERSKSNTLSTSLP